MKSVIATTTLFEDLNEIRAKLAVRTISEARKKGYQIVVVDGSPESVKEIFRKKGAIVFGEEKKGMGASRRQAIREATKLAGPDGIVIWVEPEKTPFIPHLRQVIQCLLTEKADMVIPKRRSVESYPEIQQRFEWLANQAFQMFSGESLDVWFGPRVFRSNVSSFFLNYKGEYGDKWDSILIPVFRAIKAGLKVIGLEVDYIHPKEQTIAENDFAFFEKRRKQLNCLVEALRAEELSKRNYGSSFFYLKPLNFKNFFK